MKQLYRNVDYIYLIRCQMRQTKWLAQAYNHKMFIIYSVKREIKACTPRSSLFVKRCQRKISSPHSSLDVLGVWERNWTLLQTFLSQRIFGNIWPSFVKTSLKTSFIKCHWHIGVFCNCYLCERQVCYFHFLSNVQWPWFGIFWNCKTNLSASLNLKGGGNIRLWD